MVAKIFNTNTRTGEQWLVHTISTQAFATLKEAKQYCKANGLEYRVEKRDLKSLL